MFKFHFNGLVINVLTTPGGWESMHIPISDLIIAFISILIIFLIETIILLLIIKHNRWLHQKSISIIKMFVCIWIISFFIHRVSFAIADVNNQSSILNSTKIIPLYTPITIKRFLSKYTNFKWEKPLTINNNSSKQLKYPISSYDNTPLKTNFNIIWIIADSLRYDVYNQENMPNTWQLGQNSQVFHKHYSGGNATRTGLFTLFYGVHGFYWQSFLKARKSPYFIDRLIESGYKFFIASGISLSFPEFKQTNFIKVVDYINDTYDGTTPDKRDQQATNDVQRFIATLSDNDKFFIFLLLDSSHSTYNFPDEFAKYKPYTKSYHYAKALNKDLVQKIVNRYKNSVYYVDHLIGSIITTLKKHNKLTTTIILISGDHAEEFYEYGFWGHTSGFSPAQIQVPMIIYVPGMQHQNYYHYTQHQDVVPTILKILHDPNDHQIHSVGKIMFEKPQDDNHTYMVSCGWEKCALIDSLGWLIFGTETYSFAQNEILNTAYKPLHHPLSSKNLNIRAKNIIKIMQEMTKFLK